MGLTTLTHDVTPLLTSVGDLFLAGTIGNGSSYTLSGAANALNHFGAKYAFIRCTYTLLATQTLATQTVGIGNDGDYSYGGKFNIILPQLQAGAVGIPLSITGLVELVNGSIECYRFNSGAGVQVPIDVYVLGFTAETAKVY